MRGSCDWLFVYVGSGVSLGVAKLWACGVQCVGWQFYANNSIERALHMSRRPLVSSEILGHRLQDPLLPFWQRFTSGGVMLCLNTSNMGKLQVFFIWGFCQFVGFSQISSSWKQRGLELVGLGGDFFFFFSFHHLFWVDHLSIVTRRWYLTFLREESYVKLRAAVNLCSLCPMKFRQFFSFVRPFGFSKPPRWC